MLYWVIVVGIRLVSRETMEYCTLVRSLVKLHRLLWLISPILDRHASSQFFAEYEG